MKGNNQQILRRSRSRRPQPGRLCKSEVGAGFWLRTKGRALELVSGISPHSVEPMLFLSGAKPGRERQSPRERRLWSRGPRCLCVQIRLRVSGNSAPTWVVVGEERVRHRVAEERARHEVVAARGRRAQSEADSQLPVPDPSLFLLIKA